jgi:hypothetical protein
LPIIFHRFPGFDANYCFHHSDVDTALFTGRIKDTLTGFKNSSAVKIYSLVRFLALPGCLGFYGGSSTGPGWNRVYHHVDTAYFDAATRKIFLQ